MEIFLDNGSFLESRSQTLLVCVIFGLLASWLGKLLMSYAWRRTHNEPIFSASSYCPNCNRKLSFLDTLPLVSWLFLKARCRYCGSHISALYPLAEISCAGLWISILMRYGVNPEALEMIVFGSALLAATLVNLLDYTIPNSCIAVAILARLAFFAYEASTGVSVGEDLASSMFSASVLAAILTINASLCSAFLHREVMGGGIIKLFALAGFYFGWQMTMVTAALAALCAGLVALIGIGRSPELAVGEEAFLPLDEELFAEDDAAPIYYQESTDSLRFEEDFAEPLGLTPFGPSLALACWLTILMGVPIAPWNTGLF